jgi:hypothetical protein
VEGINMTKISREASAIAAANLVQAVMAARTAKPAEARIRMDPVTQAEGLYRRFFALVRAMEE